MEVAVTTTALKTCKVPGKSSPPTNQHSYFFEARCPSCRPTNSVKEHNGFAQFACFTYKHTLQFQRPFFSGFAGGPLKSRSATGTSLKLKALQ